MVRRLSGRAMWLRIFTVVAAMAVAVPLAAQAVGIVKGVIKDDKGQPAEGAKVTLDLGGDKPRHFESHTNKKGEFVQAGLPPGEYRMTVEKDKLGAVGRVTVRASATFTADMAMAPGGAVVGGAAAGMNAALKKAFDEGLALSNEGKHDEAIAKFNEAVAINAKCNDCYDNIAFSYMAKKDYEKAEEAYKKAIDIKAEDAAAYNGLANLYNAQRKFDLAAQASAKATELSAGGTLGGGAAGGGGSADALFNQGVILWNSGKIAEAKKAFEGAVQANPSLAEAHFQLGMALVNEGNMAGAGSEFDTYLKLSPSGPNAATAKALLSQVRP